MGMMRRTLVLAAFLAVLMPAGALAHAQDKDKKQEEAEISIPGPVESDQHREDLIGDIKMGAEYAAEVEKDLELSTDEKAIAKVQSIGQKLAEVANKHRVKVTWGDERLNPFPYTFKVVKGDDVNAFSIPGGYLYVHEGLIDFTESDAELAGVLAHEISHASFRHIHTLRKESSKLDIIQIPLMLAVLLGGGSDAAIGALQAGNMATSALQSGWSVKAESSADYGAVQYMKEAGYNPVGVLTMMERLAWKERSGPNFDWGIYQTHPPSTERAGAIIDALTAYNIPIRRSQTTETFAARVQVGEEGAVDVWFGDHLIHSFRGDEAVPRADSAVKRINSFMDGVPQLYQVSQRGQRILGDGRTLFEVLPSDVLPGTGHVEEQTEVHSRLRKTVYDLNYRLWNKKLRRDDRPWDKFGGGLLQ